MAIPTVKERKKSCTIRDLRKGDYFMITEKKDDSVYQVIHPWSPDHSYVEEKNPVLQAYTKLLDFTSSAQQNTMMAFCLNTGEVTFFDLSYSCVATKEVIPIDEEDIIIHVTLKSAGGI